jgi:hypothetical protein
MGSLDAEGDVPAEDTIGVSTTMYQLPVIDLLGVGLTPVYIYLATDHDDMKAERKAAHTITFPLLNIMLHKFRLCAIPVDLRSGVTRPQTHCKLCLKISLDEIDRCRPFFLCFLGMRYGFVPFDMYETLSLPDNSQYAWIREFPQTLSILHYEVLHAILNTTKPRVDNAAHGHYSAPGMYFHSDPGMKLAPLIRAAYGADYESELSSRLPGAHAMHAACPVDDRRRSRHAFPRTCAPASVVSGVDASQDIPSIPSTTLFYMRSPSFLESANFQEAMNGEEREIDNARRKIEENQLRRLELLANEEEVKLKTLLDKEPDDDHWAGDWLEIFVFDASGLIAKKAKGKKSSSKQDQKSDAARREASQDIMSVSRPGSSLSQRQAPPLADASSSSAPSGLEDDGGGDEPPPEAASASVDPLAPHEHAPDEPVHTRPKSALRASHSEDKTESGQQAEVLFAADDEVFVFEESADHGSGQRPETAVQFFEGGVGVEGTEEHPEDEFMNAGGVVATAAESGKSEFDSNVPEAEVKSGYQLTLTFGESVRYTKWIPLTQSSWNELIRIPVREGIKLQGQGKVTVKLLKRQNSKDETVGDSKLEVARLLPHKTEFSIIKLSSSVQVSMQVAFLPERVQVSHTLVVAHAV